tara:strand:- start:24309 stop:24752 length:444 start_codon:yes stop_codon:yes gene_type:complete
MTDNQTSIHGRKLGLGTKNQLISNGIQITRPCVDASIAIGAEVSDARTITVQLKDAHGADIDYVETFELIVFSSTARTAFATGGSTGVAIGTDGAALAVVAKKYFLCTSEADGDWDGTWTDTGTESVAIGIRLPNGRVVMSAAFANT